jgi:hypothetical protein
MAEMTRSPVPLVALLAVLAGGCARDAQTPGRRTEPVRWARPGWGPEAEGLQCRLTPIKRRWQADDSPTLEVDLRNTGQRIFAFRMAEQPPLDRIAINGRWYRWQEPTGGGTRMWPLAPGVEFSDLSVALPQSLHSSLSPGRHRIQVAFVLEGVEVVSNVVMIEILPGS